LIFTVAVSEPAGPLDDSGKAKDNVPVAPEQAIAPMPLTGKEAADAGATLMLATIPAASAITEHALANVLERVR
jgi:hypothetical protein